MRTLHVVASKHLGGAELFMFRLMRALTAAGTPSRAVVRRGSDVHQALPQEEVGAALPLASNFDLRSIMALRSLVRREDIDIVQTYMHRATTLTRLPESRGAIHIARIGGYYKLKYFRNAHYWVTNTAWQRRWLIESGFPAERVFHIDNFVDAPETLQPGEVAALRNSLGLPDDAYVILSAGRFIERKGFQDLVAAFAKLPASVGSRPLHLVLPGDGDLREALEEQARTAGVAGRVHFPGWQSRLTAWWGLADMAVMASRTEVQGNMQLEAIVHRVPLVATATDGANELLTDGENALLAPTDNPDGLAARIRELLDAPAAERQRLIDNGLQLIDTRFSQHACIANYQQLYADLLQKRRTRLSAKAA